MVDEELEDVELEDEDGVELESLFAPLELESPPLPSPETFEAPLSCFSPAEVLGLDRLGFFNLFE